MKIASINTNPYTRQVNMKGLPSLSQACNTFHPHLNTTSFPSISNITERGNRKIVSPQCKLDAEPTFAIFKLMIDNSNLGMAKIRYNDTDLNNRYVYICNLISFWGKSFKGIGSALLDNIFAHNLQKGYNGKLKVDAYNSYGKEAYRNYGGKKPSPLPFYYEYGFRGIGALDEVKIDNMMGAYWKFDKEPQNHVYKLYLPLESIAQTKRRLNLA